MNDAVGYKIRNIETKLFSTGGSSPSFSKTGKIWYKLGHVKAHITEFHKKIYEYPRNISYDNCEIVEVVVSENKLPENSLQIYAEVGIITSNKQDIIRGLIKHYVLTGECFSTEFKRVLTKTYKHTEFDSLVNELVPHEMLENFDLYHNNGVKKCSTIELGKIMLTATNEQIKMYKL